jgi:putative addiction module component (TIGR02574 family)
MSVAELEKAFEALSPAEKEQFTEWYETKLAQGGFDLENDQAWGEEIERRIAEIESGQARCIPVEEVFAALRKRHGREA